MNKFGILSTTVALAALLSTSAMAQDAHTGFYAGASFASASGTDEYLPYYGGGMKLHGSMGGIEGGWNGMFEHIVYGPFFKVQAGSVSGTQHDDYGGGASQDHTMSVKGTAAVGFLAGVPVKLFGVNFLPFGDVTETFGVVENKYRYHDPNPAFSSDSASTTFASHWNWDAGLSAALDDSSWTVTVAYGTSNLDLYHGHDNLGNHWGEKASLGGIWGGLRHTF